MWYIAYRNYRQNKTWSLYGPIIQKQQQITNDWALQKTKRSASLMKILFNFWVVGDKFEEGICLCQRRKKNPTILILIILN